MLDFCVYRTATAIDTSQHAKGLPSMERRRLALAFILQTHKLSTRYVSTAKVFETLPSPAYNTVLAVFTHTDARPGETQHGTAKARHGTTAAAIGAKGTYRASLGESRRDVGGISHGGLTLDGHCFSAPGRLGPEAAKQHRNDITVHCLKVTNMVV